MFAFLVFAGAAALYLVRDQFGAQPVDTAALPTIQQAITHVPGHDAVGRDLADVPRPAGSVRSYFLDTKSVVSIVYSQHDDLLGVKQDLQSRLADRGWKQLGGTAGGADVQGSSRLWREVFFKADVVLQVSVFRNGDVTATAYVLQVQTP